MNHLQVPQVLYRVQNKEGKGPYRDPKICYGLLDHHNEPKKHPSPPYDPKIKRCIKKEEKCAFQNLDSLFNWFTDKELDELERLGYEMTEVLGIVTVVGKHQVLFIPLENTLDIPSMN